MGEGGDSGGGVWHDGQLAGNLWTTIGHKKDPIAAMLTRNAEQSALKATNKSYAAILPVLTQFTQPAVGSANEVGGVISIGSPYKNIIEAE